MAVRTGEIFNSLVFGGVHSADYGIYITGEAVFNAPKRVVDMVSVPGRNGSIAIDQGHWENITVTYPAGTFGMSETEFRTALSDFRNAICSQIGYQRLTDTYHPDEYRMGLYVDGLEVEPKRDNTAGQFDLTFDCKPQRWLTSGEVPVTIGEWGETETVSGDMVEIDNPNGVTAVKSLSVTLEPIQDLNGYDKPWVGGAGKNKLDTSGMSTDGQSGVTFSRASDGTITVGGRANTTVYRVIGSIQTENGVQYTITGTPSGGASGKYRMTVGGYGYDYGSGYTFTGDGNSHDVSIDIYTGYPSSGTLTFKPMIRLASETDATYEPYSNECPISGRDSVVTNVAGKNWLNPSTWLNLSEFGGLTFVHNADGTVKINGTAEWSMDVNVFAPIRLSAGTYKLMDKSATSDVYMFFRKNTTLDWYKPEQEFTIDGTENDTWMSFHCPNGTTVNKTFYPMIVPATVTDTSYEPYKTPNTVTTDLERTVYGGILDVVSGELTVNYGKYTVPSNISVTDRISSQNRVYWEFADMASGTYLNDDMVVCNLLEKTNASNEAPIPCIAVGVNSKYVYLQGLTHINGVTDLATFRTWLADNPIEFTYKLATPQTYQLTPQEVSLLLGQNYVWSDGSVSVEYGQNPSVLFNPTQYDASPLLEVEGYGTIGFNESEIELSDGNVGEVVISNQPTVSVVKIPQWTLNEGDTITVGATTFSWVVEGINGYAFSKSVSPTSTDDGAGTTTHTDGRSDTICYFTTSFDSTTFTYGTASSVSNNVTVTARLQHASAADVTLTVRAHQRITYDGADTIKFTNNGTAVQYQCAKMSVRSLSHGVVTAVSTLNVLGHPTYIDCQTGEAYRMVDGTAVSLNKYIDLGSDLPTLKSGSNEVTIDNTITELKVQPNWWKL